MISVTVQTPTDPPTIILGCSGELDLTAIHIWAGDNSRIFIDGVGTRGYTVRGGFITTAEVMDELCIKWLLSRLGE